MLFYATCYVWIRFCGSNTEYCTFTSPGLCEWFYFKVDFIWLLINLDYPIFELWPDPNSLNATLFQTQYSVYPPFTTDHHCTGCLQPTQMIAELEDQSSRLNQIQHNEKLDSLAASAVSCTPDNLMVDSWQTEKKNSQKNSIGWDILVFSLYQSKKNQKHFPSCNLIDLLWDPARLAWPYILHDPSLKTSR